MTDRFEEEARRIAWAYGPEHKERLAKEIAQAMRDEAAKTWSEAIDIAIHQDNPILSSALQAAAQMETRARATELEWTVVSYRIFRSRLVAWWHTLTHRGHVVLRNYRDGRPVNEWFCMKCEGK